MLSSIHFPAAIYRNFVFILIILWWIHHSQYPPFPSTATLTPDFLFFCFFSSRDFVANICWRSSLRVESSQAPGWRRRREWRRRTPPAKWVSGASLERPSESSSSWLSVSQESPLAVSSSTPEGGQMVRTWFVFILATKCKHCTARYTRVGEAVWSSVPSSKD